MLTTQTEVRTIRVTARQINAAANAIKEKYSVLSKDWARQAIEVATKYNGSIELDASSTLAMTIKDM